MPMTDDAYVHHSDHHPTSFTADQIREGCLPGRRIVVRSKGSETTAWHVTKFVHFRESGTHGTYAACDSPGNHTGPVAEWHATWRDLQAHAGFLRETCVVSEQGAVDLPLGPKRCRVYTVTEGNRVTRYCFAVDTPGMPLRVAVEDDGSAVDESVVGEDAYG